MIELSVLFVTVSSSNVPFAAGLRPSMPHRPEHLTDTPANRLVDPAMILERPQHSSIRPGVSIELSRLSVTYTQM
jgi:hypothetical protein